MKIYIGIDDTDSDHSPMGTGKLVRMLGSKLPEGCRLWGVIRHQLPQLAGIPFTSHNSSACAVVHSGGAVDLPALADLAAEHVLGLCSEGSDPGLCVVAEQDVQEKLIAFGLACTCRIMTQDQAHAAAEGVFLRGLGGTLDGVIGAAAAVGLTVNGWTGRFIEYGNLRDFDCPARVGDLNAAGVRVVSVDRDAWVPMPDDMVDTQGWLRPYLWAGCPTLPVTSEGAGNWRTLHKKGRKKPKDAPEAM